MEKEKLAEFNKKIEAILKEYDCTLQVGYTINVVPNQVPVTGTPVPEVTPEVVKDEKKAK